MTDTGRHEDWEYRQYYATKRVQIWQQARADAGEPVTFAETLDAFRDAGDAYDSGDLLREIRRNRALSGGGAWTHNELLEKLRYLATRLGHTPCIRDINEAGAPYHTTYFKVFGSLREGQTQAGLEANPVGRRGAA